MTNQPSKVRFGLPADEERSGNRSFNGLQFALKSKDVVRTVERTLVPDEKNFTGMRVGEVPTQFWAFGAGSNRSILALGLPDRALF